MPGFLISGMGYRPPLPDSITLKNVASGSQMRFLGGAETHASNKIPIIARSFLNVIVRSFRTFRMQAGRVELVSIIEPPDFPVHVEERLNNFA
jgi:hypothetical protein